MKNAKKGGLAGLFWPALFACGCVFAYWTYWKNVADGIETAVRNALPASAASAVAVSGFPYRLTLEIVDLNVRNQSGYGVQAKSVVATATPLNPRLWVLEGATEPKLALQQGQYRPLQAKKLQASLRIGDNKLDRFSLTFDGIDALDRTSGAVVWQVGKGQLHLVSDPNTPDVLGSTG
ncbi:MAG: DUF2125 domain-containing protein [Hyphomonadaceae bacterium]|nr:DUF2125 domain-containing protein [Hyphomonadaceae bacterium]